MSGNEKKDGSIKVEDKRLFNPDGTVRQEADLADSGAKEVKSSDHSPEKPSPPPADFQLNFSTFILSLASSVQISLGLIAHPSTGKAEVDLLSAKHTIDLLGMLEEKTKGNLTKEEEQILRQILFELRLQYVEVSKK